MNNPYFKNTGPYEISFLINAIGLKVDNLTKDKITDIKDLSTSQNNEITFFTQKNTVK